MSRLSGAEKLQSSPGAKSPRYVAAALQIGIVTSYSYIHVLIQLHLQ